MEKNENLEQIESSYEETEETEIEESRVEETINPHNQKQETVNTAIDIAKKYALSSMPVRNAGINGLVKAGFRSISSLNRPAEKKYLTMMCGKLSQIRSYRDYESLGGEELLNSIATNLPIYIKRDRDGYISNPDHLIDIFGEIWDIQRVFGDNSSREPLRRAAKQAISELRKSNRQGCADVLENIVGDD